MVMGERSEYRECVGGATGGEPKRGGGGSSERVCMVLVVW